MTNNELYRMINLPEGVINQLNEYEKKRNQDLPEELKHKLICRETWDSAVKEIRNFLGADSYSMNVLWEQLNLVASYSYEEYQKKGISDEVFVATMSFITRFVSQTCDENGKYTYNKDWWFPRQIALQEFRIGSLEYEFEDFMGKREVVVHIPSDANMQIEVLKQSFEDFFEFRKQYFPEWQEVTLGTDTWMLMPELEDFLPSDSKILAFKHLFDIDSVDYEQTWYMEWLFPGYEKIDDNLPEKTTLQRNLKSFLLKGNKFGVAKGHLVEERLK